MSSEAGDRLGVLTARERRWLDALVILGTCVVAIVLIGLVSNLLLFFGDILLMLFLAWLLAFVLSPAANAILRLLPVLPRGIAVVITYALLLVALVLLALLAAQSLADSIRSFIDTVPTLQAQIPSLVEPINDQLRNIGLQVDLVAASRTILENIASISTNVAGPLSDIALASVGALGNLVIILFLSLYIALDSERITTFFIRVVPPQYADEVRLFERSVSSSFGGFLRGQAIMGVGYGAFAALVGFVFNLDFIPVMATLSGVLQAIPFFGPFVSWAPPVLVAAFVNPAAFLPVFVLMWAAWFIVMNVVQPRLMSESVGIHPIVVLASVLVGIKLAGAIGAVFGIPVAAVVSSFFFYYLNRQSADPRTVAARAARRLSEREGRPVRVPSPPSLTEVHRRADYPETDTYSYPFETPAGPPAGPLSGPPPGPPPGPPSGPPAAAPEGGAMGQRGPSAGWYRTPRGEPLSPAEDPGYPRAPGERPVGPPGIPRP